MNRTVLRAQPESLTPDVPMPPLPDRILSRINLALLDGLCKEKPGHDPYDTSIDRTRDVWGKRKRI